MDNKTVDKFLIINILYVKNNNQFIQYIYDGIVTDFPQLKPYFRVYLAIFLLSVQLEILCLRRG